jgi:hypothetical protein
MVFPIQNLKDSWPTMFKPIGMQFKLSMVTKIQVSQWLIKNELVFSLESILRHIHKTTYQVEVPRII